MLDRPIDTRPWVAPSRQVQEFHAVNALSIGARIAWLEAQTGVSYGTLRRHYGQWMSSEDRSELQRFAELDPTLFRHEPGKLSSTSRQRGGQLPKNLRAHYVGKVREGGLEPPRLPTGS